MPTPPVPPRVLVPTNRAGARSAGISDWQLRHAGIVRMSRDTYLPRAASDVLRQRIDAVLLGAPPEAVLSHLTAAALWGYEVPLVADDRRVHLSVPVERRVRSRADRVVHAAAVPAPETRRLSGLLVTSPSRTWIDLAAVLPPGALLAVTDQMLAGGFPADEFPNIVRRSRGRRGAARARAVMSIGDPLAGSPMESVLRWLIHEAGLPRPVLQHVVRDDSGRFVASVDMAWPERRVLVEFDGDVHRERRVFVNDLRRQNGIVLAGWRVLRFSSADVLGRQAAVVGLLAGALSGS
ncbi:endonuclease domain-containing protein [Blastococcus capsensis]|uniref:endonuclease domain-containing protein n=1 Tax=Blastococcus capsensis TaxID=1564163 RepID=UPI002541824C|nr:DUF559 domain-containing protein [Blastococcus capsensis]MDK3255543.1 DUF559 domain-containing protein [Blastococcus capsensis]